MPLNPQEAQLFVGAFQKALGQFISTEAPVAPQRPTNSNEAGAAYGQLVTVAVQLLETLNTIASHLAVGIEAQYTAHDAGLDNSPTNEIRTPRKRGPKPKGDSAAPSVAGGDPPPNPPSNGSAQVAPPAPPPMFPAQAPAVQEAADDPLGEAKMPDFLQRAPAPPPAIAPQLTEQQMKDTLRQYMQKHGEQGTARLTNLLQSIGGVKRFSELAPEKWPAVLQAANAELSQ